MNVNLPGARAWPALPREFYVFFQQLANGANAVGSVDLTDITQRLSAVEAATSEPAGGQVRGTQSVQTVGVLPNFVTFTLVNDAAAPGNGYVYGTDASGKKGWRTTASMLAHTSDVTLNVGADGVTTVGLSDAGVSAGTYGSSAAIPVLTVDAKGRITNASEAAIAMPTQVFNRIDASGDIRVAADGSLRIAH